MFAMKHGHMPELKPEELARLKAGGKSVEELTTFCQKIADKHRRNRRAAGGRKSGSSDEGDGGQLLGSGSKGEDDFHHPFKTRENIVMNIRNAVQRPTTTPEERIMADSTTLRKQFPVSSGQAHHTKVLELEWKPVNREEEDKKNREDNMQVALLASRTYQKEGSCPPPPPPPPDNKEKADAAGPSTNVAAATSDSESAVPDKSKTAAAVPFWKSTADANNEMETQRGEQPLPPGVGVSGAAIAPPPLPKSAPAVPTPQPSVPLPPNVVAAQQAAMQIAKNYQGLAVTNVANLPKLVKDEDRVFKDEEFVAPKKPSENLGDIIGKRLSAMKKLKDNPNDSSALMLMNQAQKQMEDWAGSSGSKDLPGQFTGSTPLKQLSQEELHRGSAGAAPNKNMFKNAAPVKGGMGMHLLQKMGWKPGEGLGKSSTGKVQPLSLDIKTDRKGLVAQEEQQDHVMKEMKAKLEAAHQATLAQQQAAAAAAAARAANTPGPSNMRMPGLQLPPGFNIQPGLAIRPPGVPGAGLQGMFGGGMPSQPVLRDFSGKHPVSALMELCNKKRWGTPNFNMINNAQAPAQNQQFLFKVNVNNVEYQPSTTAPNKKTARLQAAQAVLQALGLLPR